jgi:hypothetical protein
MPKAAGRVWGSVFFLDDTSPIADGFKKELKRGDDFSIIWPPGIGLKIRRLKRVITD